MRRGVLISTTAAVLLATSLFRASPALPAAEAPAGGGPPLSPVFGLPIPEGYRGWQLIAVSHRTDNKDELRAILGNPAAFAALRDGTLPLPDGSILAKLA